MHMHMSMCVVCMYRHMHHVIFIWTCVGVMCDCTCGTHLHECACVVHLFVDVVGIKCMHVHRCMDV